MKACVKIFDSRKTSLVALVNFGSILIVILGNGGALSGPVFLNTSNTCCKLKLFSVALSLCVFLLCCVSVGLCWSHVKWNQPRKYRNKKPTLTAACCLCIMCVFVPKVGGAFSLHNMCLTGTCCQALFFFNECSCIETVDGHVLVLQELQQLTRPERVYLTAIHK